jgi:putative hemolysin
MTNVLFEVTAIILLIIANGIFAMSEMAIVAARKSRLRDWAARGNTGAKAALKLSENPNQFFSTVQIGITLVGILAGAFGGRTLAHEIAWRTIRVYAPGMCTHRLRRAWPSFHLSLPRKCHTVD